VGSPDIKHGNAGDAAPESRPARRTRYTSLAGYTDARIGYQKADERLLAVAEATANITGGFPVSQDPESSAQNRLICIRRAATEDTAGAANNRRYVRIAAN
jgi:hypothetical protein